MHRDKAADGGLDHWNRMHLTQLDDLQDLLDQKANLALADPNQEKSAGRSTH
jgi:hypothetical protein